MSVMARQSTARTLMVGPVLDASGVAVTNGVVGDFKISKNGGAPAALDGSATLTHRHTGFYSLALTATDLDTVGQAEVTIDDTVNACPLSRLTVVEEAVYDALFAASAPGYLQPTTAGRTLDVSAGGEAGVDWANVGSPTTTVGLTGTTFSVTQVIASVSGAVGSVTGAVASVTAAVTVGTINAGVITATAIADGALTAAKFAAGAFDAVWSVTTRTLTTVADSAGVTTLLGKLAGITLLAEWLGLIAGKQAGNATARTEVRATGAGSGTFDETTDSQEALRDRGDAAWTTATGFSTHSAADVWAVGTRTLTAFDAAFKTGYALSSAGVQAIWDALTSALTTVGSIGKLLVDNLNATISSRLASASYTTPPTVGAIADQVWDETLADHLGAGSTGAGLNAAGSAGDPWATAVPGAYGAGTAGKTLGDNLNATVSSRSSHSAADVWTSATRTLTSFGSLVADTTTAVWAAATRSLTTFGTLAADVWASVARTLTAATNITSTGGTTVPQTGDSFARIGAPAGASASADIAAVKADTAAVKLKTDALPADPADASDVSAGLSSLAGTLATILAAVDTEIAAIKAKTDNLPTDPADESSLQAAIAALSIPTVVQIAEGLLNTSLAAGTDDQTRSVRNALRFLRNRWAIAGGTLSVYKEDDTTAAWTAVATQTAGDPVSQVDPT